MKNKLNLFRQYADGLVKFLFTITFLLTLCVGQMWATTATLYIDIENANWAENSNSIYVWDSSKSKNIKFSYVSTNLYKSDEEVTQGITLYFKQTKQNDPNTKYNQASGTYNGTNNCFRLSGWTSGSFSYNISKVSKTNYIYFNNATTGWTNTYKYFVIGHDEPTAHSKVYALSSISNTKLLYVAQSSNDWSDVTYYGFNASNSSYSDGSWGTASYDDANKYVAPYKDKYDMNSGSSYYCVPSAAANNSSFSITYKDGYGSIPKFNAVQAAKKRDTGTSYSEVDGTYPATLSLQGTYLNGNGSSDQTTISRTKSSDGTDKSTYGTVVTGKVTHSYSSLSGSYYFEGWGTGSTPSVTTATHSYNISAATTTYAFFSKLYTLDYDRKGTYSSSTLAVSIADFSGTKTSGSSIPTGHEITFTASPATGYEVEGWYSNEGCTTPYTSGSGGVTISADKNTFTLASLNANSEVYCKFRRKTTTVTLNLHGADAGDESVTATFDQVLPSFTLATKDGGYNLTGYWTAASDGTKIINADGTLVRNTSYSTDAATPLWKHTGSSLTLHAQWNSFLTVTYDGNENTGGDAPTDATEYASGDEVTVASAPVGMVKAGYSFAGWNTAPGGGGTSYAAGATFNITANTTLYAQWTENLTTVTISASPAGTGTFTVNSVAGSSASAGVATTKSIVAVPHADYTWTSWTATNCSVSPTNNKSTTLSGDGSSSTGTLVGTFTQVPCTLWYHTSSATFADKTGQIIMSYDLEEDAYYADVNSTPSSPYYFRFYHNGATQYSAAWDGSYPNVQTAVVNGSKISCTNVNDWGSKSSIKYVGNSGTSIRIWFDYQNKKAWITADKDNQYVLRGYKYDDSGAGGMPSWSATTTYFDGLASGNTGTITATLNAATKYKFKVYDRFSDTWYGHSTNNVEQEVTDGDLFATGTGTNNNFYFTSTIAGTYTFTVDKTSGLKVKVDFPASYQLNYDIGTVKGTSGSISTDPTTASGSYVPSGNSVELTAPDKKTGYTWKGWFTNAAGTEGQIADEDRVITVTMNADKTLYACYTENTYPVSVSAGSNGDVSPKGTVNVKQVSGTSLTATPSTGYHFDHWAISGGGITPSSSTTSPQTFKATETGGTIQAIFAETTYTVNVNSGNSDFGSVSTTSVSGIGIATYSDEITATPETGATFTGWTLPSGVTAAAGYTSSSNPIKINATASGKAITANFSETKHTATITTEDDDYGTVSPTSASVGQITAVQITASKKTGYMFAGWEQTAGSGTVTYHVAAGAGSSVDATGSTQSITYITIDGNVTLQATWEEDRSAGWFLRGTWTDGWSKTGEKPFIKNVGETAGTVSYVRWTLAPEMFTDATMQMKMYDGSTYYGHSTDFGAAGNLCTKDNNNSNITFYSGVAYQNFKVSIPVAGEYIFRWDSSTKQLTITYPAGNFIRGTFDSWSWDHVLEPTGNANEYSCVISMTGDKAPHAWTGSDGFKVVLAGDHYGKNSTGITRASNSVSSLSSTGANINWTTDVRGDYTFTVNSSSKTVTVTYPSAYTVTYGYGTGGSSVSASATSVGGTFSSGAYVAAGDDITLTQTPVDGNTFKGWYDAASGGDAISCMASDNVYDDIAGNINVYAQYTPTTYTNVTLNATTGSTNGAYSVTFGGTTITVTADPLKTGYEPEGFYESYADGNWTNKIAASDGTLQSGTTYTDATGHWKATNSPTLYTKWQPKTYTVTLDKNGSSAGYLTNGSVTATYDSNTLTSLTVPTRTGYYLVDGYYEEPGLTNKIINLNGTLCTSTAYTDASGNWTNDGAVTLYAKWAPNTYTITFDPADGTVDPTSASVTFDAAVSNAPVPTRTGYTFTGYNTAGGASITTNAGVFKSSVDGFTDGSAHWVQPDDATITAQWTANPYTITLTQSTETGYGSAGTASVDATFDAALPTIASLPTAANGYAFMGYFTDHNGVGTQYYDADGTKLVASYTTADGLELFAYFKKAEITAITFSPDAVVAPNATITATPTISPTPTGTTNICWRVLYSNGNPLAEQPTFTPVSGNTVSFPASATSGSYKLEAVLHLGSGCGGTELSTYVANFQVAGDHEVTVQYKDASGNTLQASGTVTGKPLEWSAEAITAPDIFGYTFARWEAGDGVTLSKDGSTDHAFDTAQVASIYIKAVYDGRLTAVYNQNQMIYFKNTLGWENVFVNFHTGDAWNNTNNAQSSPKGVGNSGLSEKNRNNHMIQIGESDVYYYDYGAASISPSLYISFTNKSRDGVDEFWAENPGINVVYPANYADAISTDKSSENGFKAATPMFVPLAPQTPVAKNVTPTGKANYYNSGYWTKYTEGTGYTLEIYYDNDASSCIQSIPFTSADDLMPMTAKVDLEASTTYRYQVRRGGTESAGIYYGNTGTMTYDNHGDGTGWIMENTMAGGFKKAKITTNASGDYTFNLSYSASNESQYRLRMKVDYPIANNDYRLVYSDATQTKPIISAIVTKANNSKDTVSFFIRPASAALVIQQATVTKEGAITWNDYSTITSSVSGLAKDSVYNICLTMDGTGAISVENVEAYTGNFYIRTNAAGSSKWDNFRSSDHLMTYSEYSAKNSDYSHYFMAYVGNTTNIKFVVANDYAPNISDTVIVQTYRGGDASHVDKDGNIKADANVRFMWNRHNNGAYRAYLAAAKSDGSKFLVLRANSDTDLMDENGNALINSANAGQAGYNHKAPDNSIQFVDDDNWIYKATVKVKPSAFVKLYAYFNTTYFYYKGVDNNDFDAENAIQLMTGTGEAEKIHVIYDFKTDRLVAAWIPSGNISEEREINADVMFVREHQGDIEQLTFTESGAITEIKTAYAVLRFNKWTLNNKSKAAGHAVLNPGASRYERDLFYISFPFRVSMEEVFGFGKYGQHWIVEEYDGEARAANGFWADTPSYWRFITNRKGKFFEPNKGYIIALDLDELGESSDVWNNGVENVELYFPSYGTMGDITNATVVHTLPAHAYDPAAHPTHTDDRSIKDSHWNVMSVPTYVNTKNVTFTNATWTASKPSFLYEWNMDDNSLTARSGSGYTYHAMHAYIVQYAGDVTWTSTSVTPASIVARRTYAEAPSEVEFCLELQQNEKMADHTFVRLSNDEEVSAGFAFGEDMSKEFNKTRSNIYTFIGTEQVAGNIMPMTEQTTVVPVGVIAKTAGDYTFAIPEGTNGVGVTLIDIETGIRTSLSALDYTVNLSAGTYNERFVLEISPVQQTPTGIENSEVSHQHSDVRKVLIDGILYIVKDGKMFDATGALVK